MDLREYLTKEKIPVPAFAERVGVSFQALYRYMDGSRLPRLDVIQRIADETEGCVTAQDLCAHVASKRAASSTPTEASAAS